ncbi:MAG TPA: type 4a pilus biogenesis protein PilO [Candidatus Eisenbacteria bacterium]|nr:type 4a pilus biogenesis protein PilO [Candidatus Eisenbacteria bacterium]
MAAVDFKNQATLRIILCGMLAAGALGVFFFTHFLPFGYPNRAEQLAELKATYEKKSTELARARASVADLPRFEAEYDMLHERWSMAAELLPTDRQSAGLLRKITLAGQQTGVQFVMFKPGAPRSQNYYTEMPVDIVVQGGYHQVGSFLAELANMRRIVTVSGLKLTTTPVNSYRLTTAASFNASAYSLNSGSAGSPAQAAPASTTGAPPASGGSPPEVLTKPSQPEKKGANDGHQS